MIPIFRKSIKDDSLIEDIREILLSGKIARGSYVKEFETQFAKYVGMRYALTTSSGTTAIRLALRSLMPKSRRVLIPDISFVATLQGALLEHFTPVFIDVKNDGNVSVKDLKRKVKKGDILMLVDLHGKLAVSEELLKMIHDYDLVLVEDASQSHGAEYKGRKAGSFGELGVFSLYGSKNLSTGEGGIIVTNDPKYYEKMLLQIKNGIKDEQVVELMAESLRMSNISARVGFSELSRLDSSNELRRKIAERYVSELKSFPFIELPKIDNSHVFHHFNIFVKKNIDFKKIKMFYSDNDIEVRQYYDYTLSELYNKFIQKTEVLRNSKTVSRNSFCIPIYPSLTSEEINKIVKTSVKVFENINSFIKA